MIAKLFSIYRRSPFWMRDAMGRATWPLRIAMKPFSRVRMGGYVMCLDFRDNASFKYYTDRERYESVEVGAFLSAIARNPGSVIIDVGANYGAFTLAAAAAFGRYDVFEKIIAIEPDGRAFDALKRSIVVNDFESLVLLERYIVSDSEGEAVLFENARSSADNRTHSVSSAPIRVRQPLTVPCTTIDALLQKHSIQFSSKFVVKMDIQGNEFRALSGMEAALRQSAGFLLFFEHCPYLIESAGLLLPTYHEFLRGLGADVMYEITPAGLVPLADFDAFLASVQRVQSAHDRRTEGACADYVFGRSMNVGHLVRGV